MTIMNSGTITVYGTSDDLIEVEGAVREELACYEERAFLHFDNGTTLRVYYDDVEYGVWRIDEVEDVDSHVGGVVIHKCEDREGFTGYDGPIYSDLAIVYGAESLYVIRREKVYHVE